MTKIKIILAIVIATLVLSSCDHERERRTKLLKEIDSLEQVISMDIQIYAYPLIVYSINMNSEVQILDGNGKMFVLVTGLELTPGDTLK